MARLAPLLAAVLLAAFVPAAHASVAYHSDAGVPTAQGEPGENNEITAAAGDGGVVFTDPRGIRPRDPDMGMCQALSDTQVVCQGEGAFLFGEDGNDSLQDVGLTGGFEARGGPGDDTIVARAVVARIFGDDSRVRPDDGHDTITGSDAEVVPGGPSDDFADQIEGGGGNDVIDARGGRDVASGQAGNDTVAGGDGNDDLDTSSLFTEDEQDAPGDAGDDTLVGGVGDDDINAYRGKDTVDGGAGDDSMRSIDIFLLEDEQLADTYRCGEGTDRVWAGANDRLAADCERFRTVFSCWARYPCKVTAIVSGRPKGARKAKTVAKSSKTYTSAATIDFSLSKGVKLMGSASKLSLQVVVEGYRGKRFSNASRFKLQLIR